MIVTPSWPPGSAPPNGQLGREIVNALTFTPDQSPGAGQGRMAPFSSGCLCLRYFVMPSSL